VQKKRGVRKTTPNPTDWQEREPPRAKTSGEKGGIGRNKVHCGENWLERQQKCRYCQQRKKRSQGNWVTQESTRKGSGGGRDPSEKERNKNEVTSAQR